MPSRRPLLGAMGKHVVFCDGIDDYVKVNNVDPSGGSFTYAIMFTCSEYPSIDKYLLHEYTTGSDFASKMHSDGKVEFYTRQTNGTEHRLYTPVLTLNTWYVLFYVYDEDSLTKRLYVNGSLHNQATLSAPVTNEGQDLWIGVHRALYSWAYWHGYIAYVLRYNRALSDTEIQQIYKALKDFREDIPVTDGLVLGLTPHSLDCANGIWNDISGNNNNATLYGARCLWI